MNTLTIRMIGIGILFMLTIISGIWLSKAGKPYHVALLTSHKLISLGFLILGVVQVIYLQKFVGLDQLARIIFIVAAFASVIELISGGLISAEKMTEYALIAHKIILFVLVFAFVFLFYLTYKR